METKKLRIFCSFLFSFFTGLNNPSITNGCVDQQQQRLGPTGSVQQGLVPSGNGSLQRPNGGHNLQLHAINSTVGTHVWELTSKKKLMSQSLSLSEKSCQPWSKRPLLRTKDFFALEVDLRLWRNVLISLFLYIIMKNWIFQLFLLSCWKPRIPDGFWFLCYLLQVHVTKSRFYYQIEINMWHYKEYSPSSYMWKKKLWRIKKHWKIRQIASFIS